MRPLILLPAFLPYTLALAVVTPRHFNPTPSFAHPNCGTMTVTTTTTTTLTVPGFPTAFPGNSSSGGGFFNMTTTDISISMSSTNTLEPITLVTLPSDTEDTTPTGTVEPGVAPTPNDLEPMTLIDVEAAPTI